MSEKQKTFGAAEFRAELIKIMPGYSWTVHKSSNVERLEATGTQSRGSNRISTLSILRTARDEKIHYAAKSAGYGLRARWLHTHEDRTLAKALRGLQDHYEYIASTYRSHANAIKNARSMPVSSAALPTTSKDGAPV